MLRDWMYLIRALADAGKLDSARMQFLAAMEYARRQTFDSDWLAHLGQLAEVLGDRRAAIELRDRVSKIVKPDDRNDDAALNRLQGQVALLEGRAASARILHSLARGVAIERRARRPPDGRHARSVGMPTRTAFTKRRLREARG